MSKLDKIAIKNLEHLFKLGDNIDEYHLVVDGNIISQSEEDDNYESIFNLKELEYPIYFSFHQLYNSIRYSNLYKIEGYKTQDLIQLMDSTINKVVQILEKTEEDPHNTQLCGIVDDIDDKFIVLRERDQTCSFWKIYETFNDYLDSFTEALLDVNNHMYMRRFSILEKYTNGDEEEEGEEGEGGEGEGEEGEGGEGGEEGEGEECEEGCDDGNKETGELNQNLVYEDGCECGCSCHENEGNREDTNDKKED